MKRLFFLVFSFTLFISSAFAEKNTNPPSTSKKSAKQEINASNLVEANFNFAVKMYHSMKNGDRNLFFSPYNISYTLSMLYPGARTETASQIKKALCYNYPDNNIPQSFKKLNDELINNTPARITLKSASAVWGSKESAINTDFINIIKENYNTAPEFLDFVNEPGGALNRINQWVSDNTGGKIKNIISQNSVTPDTKMILTGALYFDAWWYKEFKPRVTKNEPFYQIDGKIISVPMMNNNLAANYKETDSYQALELLYNVFDYSMIIILPKKGSFSKVENMMTPELLKSIIKSLGPKRIILKLPKFKYTSQTVSLNNILMTMGMRDAFTTSADFSGIFESEKPFVSQVLHKAFVEVNETGTTAGAATGVEITEGATPDTNINFFCDRPFIYLIYNKKIGTILFIGRMMNPKE